MSAPILAAYDYELSVGPIRHLRAGFLDAVNNGKLQFRWVYPDGTVEWIDLITGLSSVSFNFTNWWAQTTFQSELFMVNGESNIRIWSGGVTTLASTSATAGEVTGIATGVNTGTILTPNNFMLPETFGGKNYSVGDVLTLTGGDANATVTVDSVLPSAIYSVASVPTTGGSGYVAGQVLSVTGPTDTPQGGVVQVLTVDGGGGVLTIGLISQGTGYTIGTGIKTGSGTSGGGNIFGTVTPNALGTGYNVGDQVYINAGDGNAVLQVVSITGVGAVQSLSIVDAGSGYTTASNVPVIPSTGVVGTGLTVNFTANSIVSTGCTIDITEVDDGAIGTLSTTSGAVSLTTPGAGYSVASGIPVTGGTGTGALMQILAISDTSITKQGTETWAQDGFYNSGTHSVVINGVVYTATGGWNTTTLTGVTPDPTGAGMPGDLIFQTVEVFPNSTLPGLPSNFENDLIATFDQQIYIGSLVANAIYVSQVNNSGNFTFALSATPPTTIRVTGQGIILLLNSPPKAFIAQEDQLYISAGQGQWYEVTQDTLDSDLGNGTTIQVVTPVPHRLKTTGQQGAQSQAFVSKNKNDVIFLSFEPIVNSLGRVDNVVLTPQTSDLSFPIVNDINGYDFTDGCIFFWQNYILVSAPKSGVLRIYNMTLDTTSANPTNSPKHYWEAPMTVAFSRFSVIDGELYAHSYLVSETYKMFDGTNFNGSPIPAKAVFSYMQYGVRPQNKSQNEYYVEGYISPNTTLNMQVNYDLNGTSGQYNGTIVGTDTQIVQLPGSKASLGKESLGKNPLGGDLTLDGNTNKFRVVKTFPRTPYYEESPSFGSSGINDIWSIIAFGPVQSPTSEGNNPILQ